MSIIKTGSDFSGVGAFDQALKRLCIKYETIFACDWDKYARQTYIENYGEPKYYPKDVYEREIPEESLDIYMTSPPCQAFSLAGKRKGEDDERGILFYNSHEFIVKNNPRYFIFENVKGLLSDSNGRTFKVWLDLLGGKSVNGNKVLFPNENAVPYHIYWQVLNAKHYGVPQNRERVFIIGIRDDKDNSFSFPKTQHLTKRLKDVLEENVDNKYFLSEKMVNRCTTYNWAKPFTDPDKKEISNCVTASYSKQASDCEYIETNNQRDKDVFILGYTRDSKGKVIKRNKLNHANTIHTSTGGGGNTDQYVCIAASRGRGKENKQKLEKRKDNISNSITTVQKDNLVVKSFNIRRLTPRECFRLMDFPEDFKWPVSDTQAYKQAGNSIVVNVLAQIINKLKL